MKAASIAEIKIHLKQTSPAAITELCLRLARYKKENKELLTYLLFEADDLQAFLQSTKTEIEDGFAGINTTNVYFAKKSLRKILRATNKYIKYTGSKVAEAELLLHFCAQLKDSKIPTRKNTALTNLYNGVLKKAKLAITSLHEDLQYDYLTEWEKLQ